MYPQQRRDALLTLLAKHGFVSYADLANELGVSEMTVRRDLRALKEAGLVETVVGGGQVKGSANEVGFMAKRILQAEAKEEISRLARSLIEPGMTVGLTAGTTTWTLSQSLRGFRDVTFVTNSTNVALALKSGGFDDIYLTGGHFRTPSDALVGPLAEAAAMQVHTDILFMGVHGIDVEKGMSTPNMLEASVNRVLMNKTDRVVLLFDHTKWGVEAFAHIAPMDAVDDIITDVARPETNAAMQLGIRVQVV
ncbi:DeoR/GlpR family DNA-binding transcription regulator [Alicyclobacillus fodiniaquatilis]|uniref:DeoR/GlpR family DNA-binding transcription regulator n=1 Tax=Alicyclobacillus fodiniaquatilis TaxID=1661150 RepID=A0ABW4JAE4_9BACL